MTSPSMRVLGLVFALVAIGATTTIAQEKAAPKKGSTEAVLANHLNSFVMAVTEDKAKGIAGVVSDFSEESVIHTPDGSIRGLKDIGAFFTGLVAANPTFMEGFEMLHQTVDGEVAYIVWKNNEIPFATDTFVVKNGKIMVQTFTTYMAPMEEGHEGHGH